MSLYTKFFLVFETIKLSMYSCDECHEDHQHSKYHIPVVVSSEKQPKLLHVECCSKENLLEKLKQLVESETLFYKDISNLTENFNQENIEKFEKKYGTYDEHKSGIQFDKFIEILAIVDKLKK